MLESTERIDIPSQPRITAIEPILPVSDIVATTTYYHHVLDFENVWHWGDPPTHGGANRDGVGLQFGLEPELAMTSEGREIWIRVQNVSKLYARHTALNAEIVAPLEAKPWRMTEYVVRDLNGYRLRFAEVTISRGISADLPSEVRVEPRPPTWAEMEPLIYAVGWDKSTNFETAPRGLEAAVAGATAFVGDRAIGCALLMFDGSSFYYVRDVMVHPDWQRKRIGTALMRSLTQSLESIAPSGSLAGLFTGPNLNDFYAEFGFRGPDKALYGMTKPIR